MKSKLEQFFAAPHSPWDTVIIAAASLLLFAPFLGLVPLFDWDEANFGEAAREMLVSGNFLHVTIGFEPFYEKPPLFFWVQTASMAVFGVNEWAARFPNAVVGAVTLVVLFRIGSQIRDRQFGYFWVIAFAASLIPSFYFRSGIIDPLFNLLMFLAVWNVCCWDSARARGEKGPLQRIAYAGVLSGLAVLTKGPVGFGMPALVWFVFWALRRRGFPPVKEAVVFTVVAIAVGASWFVVEYATNGPGFLLAFIDYQRRLLVMGEAGHGEPIYYHVVTTLIGCFPASIVAFYGFRPQRDMSTPQRDFHYWMIVLFSCVMVVFSLVTTKILHYVSLAYFPLTYFAAVAMQRFAGGHSPGRIYRVALFVLGGVWAFAMLVLPIAAIWKESWVGLIKDPFGRANILAPVHWSAIDMLPGFVLALALGTAIHLMRRRALASHLTLFAGVVACMTLLMPMLVPKIYEHTQGAMIRFFKQAGRDDAYVWTPFLSYAQYFYRPAVPARSAAAHPELAGRKFSDWLREGPIDRPVYMITRTGRTLNGTVIREENGFVLVRRDPQSGAVK